MEDVIYNGRILDDRFLRGDLLLDVQFKGVVVSRTFNLVRKQYDYNIETVDASTIDPRGQYLIIEDRSRNEKEKVG